MRRNGKVSIVSAVAVALMVIMLVSAVSYLSKGFRDWDAKKWFEDKDIEEVVGIDENGVEIVSGKVYKMSKQITLLSTTIEEVTIEATILPEETTNKEVDWSISWVNVGSSWAQGKEVTEYVTVEATSDGATTAKLNCIEAFGEQIKITVTSRRNSEAKAECTIDFRQRMLDAYIKGEFSYDQGNPVVFTGKRMLFSELGSLKILGVDSESVQYGVGTVKSEEFTCTMELGLPLDFKMQFFQIMGVPFPSAITLSAGDSFSFNENTIFGSSLLEYCNRAPGMVGMIVPYLNEYSVGNDVTICPLNLKVTIGNGYETVSKTYQVSAGVANLFEVVAMSISLDTGNIVI